MEKQKIISILKKIEDLPTLPKIISKIMEIFEDPYANAENLTKIISLDQTLTLKTLKLANSAYYGFPRQIEDVTEAIVVLGFLTVRNLILTSSIYNIFIKDKEKNKTEFDFDIINLWRHSISVAIIAKNLVQKINIGHIIDEKEVFTLGIIHDIGKIFLDIYFNNDFYKILKNHRLNPDKPVIEIEKNILGLNHGEIGALIIDKWNLPEIYIIPVKYHHNPSLIKSNYYTLILYLADILSYYYSSTFNFDNFFKNLNEYAKENGNIDLKNIDYVEILKNSELEISNADLFLSF